MGAPKPTLGYPTRTAAVLALRDQRLTTHEIARRIGIPPETVTALEASAGRPRGRTPRPAEELGRTVLFPIDVLDALGPHAAARGMHPNSLARLIVTTVVDENMVDAVLDDADDLEGWA
jgi:hypothetical protein